MAELIISDHWLLPSNLISANDPNLVLQGYRAMLEILIQRQCPELVKQHAGVCKIKRVIGKIKKSHEIPFEQWVKYSLSWVCMSL